MGAGIFAASTLAPGLFRDGVSGSVRIAERMDWVLGVQKNSVMDWYKIAGIIFGVIAVGLIVFGVVGWVKGWQEENEPDPTKMPTKDDMEREDKYGNR